MSDELAETPNSYLITPNSSLKGGSGTHEHLYHNQRAPIVSPGGGNKTITSERRLTA